MAKQVISYKKAEAELKVLNNEKFTGAKVYPFCTDWFNFNS